MAGRNTESRRGHDAQVLFANPVDGRAVVVAADTISEHPEWLVLVAFAVGDGRTDLVGHSVIKRPDVWPEAVPGAFGSVLASYLHMFDNPKSVGTHLTTAIVRSAATTELESFARRMIAERAARGLLGPRWAESGIRPGFPEKRSASQIAGDLRKAQIARRYVELLEEPGNPKPKLAAEANLSINTINSYLHQARMRGLLTSDGQGRAGGQLTEYARELLAGKEQVT